MGGTVEALKSTVRRAVRSPAGSLAADLTARLHPTTPVRELPAWWGVLQQIRVPRGVTPAPEPTTASPANINLLLDLLDQTHDVAGDVAECGVYRGATLLTMALHLERSGDRRRAFGFDSFEGFDERVEHDVGLGGDANADKRVGGFSQTSRTEVEQRAARLGLGDRVVLRKGWFGDTLTGLDDAPFSFVHLDCDLYESYAACLEALYPRLSPGAVVLLDEYDDPPWPGCNQAVDEFLADRPETLESIQRDNHVKYLFRKH